MKLLEVGELSSSNSVYYPCLDTSYPTHPYKEHLISLAFGFDYIIIPPVHLSENTRINVIQDYVKKFFQHEIAVCSIRNGQSTLTDFFKDKASETGGKIDGFEETIEKYERSLRIGFNRDTESQSAAFKHGLLQELPIEARESIESKFPHVGIHQLHRESFDSLIEEPEWQSLRFEIEKAKKKAYFHAGANGNYSYLFDPAQVCFQNRTTNTVEAVNSFITGIFSKCGVSMSDLTKLPIEVLASIIKSSSCNRFKNSLMTALNSFDNDLSLDIDILRARIQKRKYYQNLGYWLAGLSIGAVGLLSLKAGIIALIAGSFGVPAIQKVISFWDDINDPILSFAEKTKSRYFKEIIKLN